jgi:predicted lipoprotein with Yx(FWY)xxD motif
MFGSQAETTAQSPGAGRGVNLARCVAALVVVLTGSIVATALAASALTIGSAANSSLGKRVVVNAQGRTLYALGPETAGHLLCKSRECLKFWPPLTVSSPTTKLKDGSGVHGHLGILHRSNGLLQVTLAGRPLYRFSQDHTKGQANGEGIESFGGTWHAVAAGSVSSTKPSNPAPSPSPTPMAPTPGY